MCELIVLFRRTKRVGVGLLVALMISAVCWGQPTITFYQLPAVLAPSRMISGPDGALWFCEVAYSFPTVPNPISKIGRVTTSLAFAEYPIPTANSYPVGIAVGPDGALWFTEASAKKIGRITTSGVITNEYALPDAAYPFGITRGPDGALWFAGSGSYGGSVGRITTAGEITEYAFPGRYLGEIVTGSDGALWVAESFRIERITTSGVVTEYVPPSGGGIDGITAGPDGAIWFFEVAPSRIGRLTTSGVFTEYPFPQQNNDAGEIVSGPDGALWFTEILASRIGRITTAGTITEYPIGGALGEQPTSIAVGSDGNIWFTLNTTRIGKVGLAASAPSVPAPPTFWLALSGCLVALACLLWSRRRASA